VAVLVTRLCSSAGCSQPISSIATGITGLCGGIASAGCTLGTLNTLVLIISSFTMAMGVWCAETRRKKGLVLCLMLTMILAWLFGH